MKKICTLLSLGAALLFAASACSDSDPETAPATPKIRVTPAQLTDLPAEGGGFSLSYEIENPVEGTTVEASADQTWVHDFSWTTPGKIAFTVDPNRGDARPATITVAYGNAEKVTVALTQVAYEAPVSILPYNITPFSAEFTWTADDPALRYQIGVVAKAKLEEYASEEAFLEEDLDKLLELNYWQDPIETFLDGMLYKESHTSSSSQLMLELTPDTDYYAYAYGLTLAGEFSTPLIKTLFHTPAIRDVNFNLTVTDKTGTGATFSVRPSDASIRYYVGYITEDDYTWTYQEDDNEVLNACITTIKSNMAMTGSTFEQLTYIGDTDVPTGTLTPGTGYYAVVFGLDQNLVPLTALTKEHFSTTQTTVTDDCTFQIEVPFVNSTIMKIKVSPSSFFTKYYVTAVKSSELATRTPEQIADDKVAEENGWGVDWLTKKTFTGEQVLDSRLDLGIAPFEPDTEYTILVFGVEESSTGGGDGGGGWWPTSTGSRADDDWADWGDGGWGSTSTQGVRTTAVKTAVQKTGLTQPSQMTLQINVITEGVDHIKWSVTPSTDDEYYFSALVKADDYAKFANDEAFMQATVAAAGEMIYAFYCFRGEQEMDAYYDILTGSTTPLDPATDYLVVTFGYMGGITTGLTKQEVRTAEKLLP